MIDRGELLPVKRKHSCWTVALERVYRPHPGAGSLVDAPDELHLRVPFYGTRKVAAATRGAWGWVAARDEIDAVNGGSGAVSAPTRRVFRRGEATIFPYFLAGLTT
jgi:hypothetical protein